MIFQTQVKESKQQHQVFISWLFQLNNFWSFRCSQVFIGLLGEVSLFKNHQLQPFLWFLLDFSDLMKKFCKITENGKYKIDCDIYSNIRPRGIFLSF